MPRLTFRFKPNLKSIAHFITALVIILEGISRCDHFGENWPFVVMAWALGGLVLIVTVRRDIVARWLRYPDVVLYCVEALVSLAIAIMYFREGKAAVQYPFLIASYLFTWLAGYSMGRPNGPGEH